MMTMMMMYAMDTIIYRIRTHSILFLLMLLFVSVEFSQKGFLYEEFGRLENLLGYCDEAGPLAPSFWVGAGCGPAPVLTACDIPYCPGFLYEEFGRLENLLGYCDEAGPLAPSFWVGAGCGPAPVLTACDIPYCPVFGRDDLQGPTFVTEPPTNVDFSNSTGVSIHCLVTGNPLPTVQWIHSDDRPLKELSRLRKTSSNGTLTFLPFGAEAYLQDVHATSYKCIATNVRGTITSGDIRVRAVVKQLYEAQVYDEFVIRSNVAVMKCHIPSFVMDYVTVTSWEVGDTQHNVDTPIESGNRYSLLPGGELHIRDVQHEDNKNYRCRTRHRLTGETKLSTTAGRLFVTDPQGSVPPRLANHKPNVYTEQGRTAIVPCVAQGYPTPSYSWSKKMGKTRQVALTLGGRLEQIGGTLLIRNANSQDSGSYVCLVNNTVGVERVETTVIVTEPLAVYVHPSRHIVQVGKSASFSCSVSGHPISFVRWVKNGRPLLVSEQSVHGKPVSLSITSVQKGDSGMYQCFAGNDMDTVQATAELRLGDALPIIQGGFKEENLRSGTLASLKCTAYGNPSPTITWTVDGEPLPTVRRYVVGSHFNNDGDLVSYVNITDVRTEDGGEYECTASNRVGLSRHSARLNIYGPPFVRRMHRLTTVSGKDIHVKCPYGGHPIESISWKKEGTLLPVDFRQEVLSNGTLIIRHAQRVADSGKYVCLVRNHIGQEAQQSIEIRIMIPPMIDPSTFQGHDVHEGAHARIICGVTDGDLPINFTWVKDGKSIPQLLGVVVRNIDEFSSVMTIKGVTTAHMGNYTCFAMNAATSSNYTTELKVRVPPRWKVEPNDAKLVVGDSITLDCQADGFPLPTITWMKVTGNVPSGNRQEIHNSSNLHSMLLSNGSLHISNVRSTDVGFYFCLANNGIGPGLSKKIYLNIRSPAKFDVRYRQQTARRGKVTTLTCQAVGDAPLDFSWSREDQNVDINQLPRYRSEDRRIPTGAVSLLTIEATRREDSGTYKCNVKNEYGQDSASFHLVVTEPPDAPNRVKVLDYGSRRVKLSWFQQYDGNSPIVKYRIEGKLSTVDWSEPMLLMATPKAESSAEIDGLLPATKYTFRVFAENEVGASDSSETVSVVTEDEAPGGPPEDVQVRPIDSETLQVTWKVPPRGLWNGDLLGYNVGFRLADSTKPYLYNTVEVTGKMDENSMRVELQGLQKYTRYSVVVRAFNRVGLGPLSTEVIQSTAEDVPSQSPQEIECHSITAESLQISWKIPPSFGINGVLQGYKVLYRPSEEWYGDGTVETKITSSLRTSLHGLRKFTNYSVQVLAYTRVGDGVPSEPIFCRTQEDVPEAPSEIKALALSTDSILVTWKHPTNPNGILTKYSVYVRTAEKGKEATTIDSVPPSSTHYYVRGVKEDTRYEFWVTASTSIGEGLSTSVVSQRTTGSNISARVASFGESILIREGSNFEMPCLAVGSPPPTHQWIFRNQQIVASDRHEIYKNGSLFIRHTISSDAGNYTCKIHNNYNSDQVSYIITVQEPPMSPEIVVTTATSDMINIKWKMASEGGIPLKGFIVHFKRDFGEWDEVPVPSDQYDITLERLECGTRYHVYISAKNEIGIGKPSQVTSVKTEGTAPIVPSKERVMEESSTFVTLHLDAWKTGVECPILYFVVEHKLLNSRNWTLVSNNVQSLHGQFIIPDLKPATWYNLRMTAHNTAGSTIARYDFATLTATGGTVATMVAEMSDSAHGSMPSDWSYYIYIVLSASALITAITLIAFTMCALRNRRRRRQTNAFPEEKSSTKDNDNKAASYNAAGNIMEKYDQTSTPTSFTYLMRTNKQERPSSGSRQVSDTSTKLSDEDICPYATFQIPARKSQSFNEEMKTFEECSSDQCLRDPRLDTMYAKVRHAHPNCLSNYNYAVKLEDCIAVNNVNIEEEEDPMVMAHLTESSLELHLTEQGCYCYHNQHPHNEQHVPDLLYRGPDSGSSNNTSPTSTCSYDGRTNMRMFSLGRQKQPNLHHSYDSSKDTIDDNS